MKNLSPDELDEFAWKATCNWPSYTQVNPVFNGIDSTEWLKGCLRDKVARALRSKIDPKGFAEAEALTRQYATGIRQDYHRAFPLFLRRIFRSGRVLLRLIQIFFFHLAKKQIVFAPTAKYSKTHPLRKSVEEKAGVVFVDNDITFMEKGLLALLQLLRIRPHKHFVKSLFTGILEGLSNQGIVLIKEDEACLIREMEDQMRHFLVVQIMLHYVSPVALVGVNDRVSPGISYVLAARRLAVPSVTYQHGLDCTKYVYETAAASHICVWSESRLERYRRENKAVDSQIFVCGNPNYHHKTPPRELSKSGSYWLWVCQAHLRERCYLPSLKTEMGLTLLRSLIPIIQRKKDVRLIIQPHPSGEYLSAFEELIEKFDLSSQIEINRVKPFVELLPEASLILTEATSAALDGMFLGKPLVYMDFGPTKPFMEFAEIGAALPAYTPSQLEEALSKAESLDGVETEKMFQGQINFILKHAGPLDGKATERRVEVILKAINAYRKTKTYKQSSR